MVSREKKKLYNTIIFGAHLFDAPLKYTHTHTLLLCLLSMSFVCSAIGHMREQANTYIYSIVHESANEATGWKDVSRWVCARVSLYHSSVKANKLCRRHTEWILIRIKYKCAHRIYTDNKNGNLRNNQFVIRHCASVQPASQPSNKRHTNEGKCEAAKEENWMKKKNKAHRTIETIKGNKFYRRLNHNNSES